MGVPESMFPDKLPAEKQLFSENIQLCKFYYSFLSKNSSVSHQWVYEKVFFHNFPGKTYFPPVSIYPAFIARLSWKRPCAVSRGHEMSGVWSRPKGLLGLSPPQTPAEMTAGMYAPSKSVLK